MKTSVVKPIRTVYCYYYPEMRELISEAMSPFPHEILLQSIDPGLDDFHEPVVDAYIEHMRGQMPGLSGFPHRYVAAGGSEALFHLLAHIAAFQKNAPLYVFEGEYEGYAGYGNNLGLTFTTVPFGSDAKALPPGIFFLSNPSACSGNILPNEQIEAIGATHRIVFDATYVGLTSPHEFLVDHPAVVAVVASMSKPFGLYYFRLGFCFMREELLTLMVNKWFKNVPTLVIARKALETFKASELAERYRSRQQRAVDELSGLYDVPVVASDVVLLAQVAEAALDDAQRERIKEFKRGPFYRFCLTPYFLSYEGGS